MSATLLHVSDIHSVSEPGAVVYGQNSDANLSAILDVAGGLDRQFDFVVATGDVADDGSSGAYERVDEALHGAAEVVRWVPGNHDVPERMEAAAPAGFAAVTRGGWRIVTLDTRWPGRDAGLVGDAALRRLEADLDGGGQGDAASYCVVALHHPPRSFCADPMCQVANGDEVLEIIESFPKVRAVLSGHLHRSFHFCRGGIWWIGAPSTCVQADHPSHDHTAEAPAAHVLDLADDGTVSLSWIASRPEGARK